MPVVKKARTAMPAPSTVMNAAEATGSQRVVSGPFTLQAAQEAASIHHQHAEADQHSCQAETEGNDEKEAQADAVQSEGAQQNHQRRRARDDAAGDAQGKELVERNGFGGLVRLGRYSTLFAG